MPFLSAYQNDVLVSYARVDDEPDEGEQRGLVTTLVRNLQKRLLRKLGRKSEVEVWMDHQLRGHLQLTPELQAKVCGTGVLVVVMSPAYMGSDWCQQEVACFFEKLVESDEVRSDSRVFLVELDRVPPDSRPEKLQELVAYKFWDEDPLAETIRTVSVREPKIGKTDYWAALDRLGQHLATELKALKEIELKHVADAQQEPDWSGEQTSDETPTVFLAEVTDDLDYLRDEVAATLNQARIRIVPDGRTLYPRGVAEFESGVDDDLQKCNSIFVQLLSEIAGKKPDGKRGYAQIQFELAEKAGLPILQWRSPDCEVAKAPDEHRQLLRQKTVQEIGIQTFKSTVVREARAAFEAGGTSAGNGSAPVIRIAAAECDFELAKRVDRKLAEMHANLITSTEDPIDEALRYVDGLLFVCGKSDHPDVELRVLRYRDKRHVKQPPLSWAIYQGPPPDQKLLLLTLDELRRIDGREQINEGELSKFLEEVRAHAV